MSHDEILPYRGDAPGKSGLSGGDPLNEILVFQGSDCGGVIHRTIPEHENRGDAFDRAQNGPIGLARFGKLPADDIVGLLAERLLWDSASPALKFPDQIAWDFR